MQETSITTTLTTKALEQFGHMVRAASTLASNCPHDHQVEILRSVASTCVAIMRLGLDLHTEDPLVTCEELVSRDSLIAALMDNREPTLNGSVTLVGWSQTAGITVGVHLSRDGTLFTHS